MLKRLKSKVWLYLHGAMKAAIEEALDNDSIDLKRQIWRVSRDESARYAFANIGMNKAYIDRYALMDRIIELASPTGLILEFGVWKGASLCHLATRVSPRKVYGFDSFEGLPEAWSMGMPKGAFKLDSLPEVPANVELIKGWFNETAPDFLAKHPDPISVLHIDSDLYSSAKFVLDTYRNRIIPGTVILFDDYMNYPTWTEGESKAFSEWCQSTDAKYEYVGFVAKRTGNAFEAQQVAVQITEIGNR
jgi:Methyltransferase domain